MSRQCPSCNKLPALAMVEPEAEVEIEGTTVRATVRIVRNSECCGEEMKEASFEPSEEIDPELLKDHFDPKTGEPLTEDCELELDADDAEATERSEGIGRGRKSFYGFELHWTVSCACGRDGGKTLAEGTFSDDIQASHMDEVN